MAVLRDPAADRDYPIPGPRYQIGRGPDCEIRLGDPLVSARHALVTHKNDLYEIEDLGSRNGTRINGERIDSPTPLHPGDRIELGGHLLLFAGPEPPPFALADTTQIPGPPVVRSLDLAAGLRTEVSPEAKLRAVLEISRNLSTTLRLEEVLPKILESLFALFPQTDRGFFLLREPTTKKLVPKAVRHRHAPPGDAAAISRTVLDHAVQTGRAVLSGDAGHDDRFDASQSVRLHQIRSIMCVPLVNRTGECLGVIQLDTRERGRVFTQDDLDVLAFAGLQATRAVEMANLHLELRELEAATAIQRNFLPNERPRVPGLRFFDHYVSAGQVGGDYFDYVRLTGERLAVAVGDVAGKGVTAALLMARLSAAARFCLATETTTADAVRAVNASVARACGDGRFITLSVGVIDLSTFAMTVVNAGHMPPLRRRPDGTVEEIGAGAAGIPLGVFDRPYQETPAVIEPGDLWVWCTDGVTEARDPDNELYGIDRLKAVLEKASPDAELAGPAILAEVKKFCNGRALGDDLTLVCLSREGGGPAASVPG
jgi:serine phosphatase RsbU (regulator of sigma subunit)